jgi:hypothetical protein
VGARPLPLTGLLFEAASRTAPEVPVQNTLRNKRAE